LEENVNASMWLMALTWAAGWGEAVPPGNSAPQGQVIYAAPAQPSRTPILTSLRRLFRNDALSDSMSGSGSMTYVKPMASCSSCGTNGAIIQVSATAEPPALTLEGQPSLQAAAAQPEQGMVLPVKGDYQKQLGAPEDYSWITGQLYYLLADGGRWVVRYASVDTVDRFGGSVVLAPNTSMKNFRDGDLVCIHGAIIDNTRGNRTLGGALYRVDHIDLIERGD
jgi:hypothetical protein